MTTAALLQPHASLFDQNVGNRRSACDRCRRHKLRCERDVTEAVQLDCRRCFKANAKCVTSAALKSGRPSHLHGAQQQLHIGSEQSLPTPPTSSFNTPPESSGISNNDLLVPSFSPLATFDDIWMGDLDQETASGLDATVPDGPLAPADLPNEHLKKIAFLQTGLLSDLDVVKLSRRIDKVPREILPAENNQSCNFLIGSSLHHSTVLLEILDYYKRPTADLIMNEAVAQGGLDCDVPTLMLLLCCYIHLIRIFRTIFIVILESMPLMPSFQTPVPQLFPGMNLGGFKLETRIDIQIQVLIQVSESMLSKIEAKLGMGEDQSLSVFANGRAARMLRLMMQEEADEEPVFEEPRSKCGSLKDVLNALKQLLHSGDIGKNG